MGMRRVANDRAKYILRSKVGSIVDNREQTEEDSARQIFEEAPHGYFVWGHAQKNEAEQHLAGDV